MLMYSPVRPIVLEPNRCVGVYYVYMYQYQGNRESKLLDYSTSHQTSTWCQSRWWRRFCRRRTRIERRAAGGVTAGRERIRRCPAGRRLQAAALGKALQARAGAGRAWVAQQAARSRGSSRRWPGAAGQELGAARGEGRVGGEVAGCDGGAVPGGGLGIEP